MYFCGMVGEECFVCVPKVGFGEDWLLWLKFDEGGIGWLTEYEE